MSHRQKDLLASPYASARTSFCEQKTASFLKRENRNVVIRVKDMKRDVFGDGLAIDRSLESVPFFDALLHVHTGDRRVKLCCRPGVVQCCHDPRSKDAVTEDICVLAYVVYLWKPHLASYEKYPLAHSV